jgi:hypothetical protein
VVNLFRYVTIKEQAKFLSLYNPDEAVTIDITKMETSIEQGKSRLTKLFRAKSMNKGE